MRRSQRLWFLAAAILAVTILETVRLPADEPATTAEVRQALQAPLELDYRDTPLQQIAKELHTKLDVLVYLDAKALADAGLGTDLPVTFTISDVSATAAIALMLKTLQLTTMVRHGVLIITTPEEAENNLDTRVYAVADLVALGMHGEGPFDFDSLIDMIKSTVKPTTWDDVGGPGSIAPCESGINAIVVSQNDQVHDGIENLLAELRAVRDRQTHDGMVSNWPGRSGGSASRVADPRLPSVTAAEAAVRLALNRPISFEFHQTPLGQAVATLRRRTGLRILVDVGGNGKVADQDVSLDTPMSAEAMNLPLDVALDALLKPLELTWTYHHECLFIATPEREAGLFITRATMSPTCRPFATEAAKACPITTRSST